MSSKETKKNNKRLKDDNPLYRKVTSYMEAFEWFKDKAYRFIRDISGESKKEMTARAIAFTKLNENALVVIMDTIHDTIVMAYKGEYMTSDIQSPILKTNQKLLKNVIEQKWDDEKKAGDGVREFLEITQTLFLNFFRIIKEKKVADKNNNKEKNKMEEETKTPEAPVEPTPETPAETPAE